MKNISGLLGLTFVVNLVVGCGSSTECPTGTAKVGTRCAPVDETDQDPVGKADAGTDPGTPDPLTDAAVIDAAAVVVDASADVDATSGQVCYLDQDHDGVGAGEPVNCKGTESGADGGAGDGGPAQGDASTGVAPSVVQLTGDCDDFDAHRAPTLAEECDGIDNDCDNTLDDGAKNICGGVCTGVLAHAPGDVCSNGLLGACAHEGEYICLVDGTLACSAPLVDAVAELCTDDIDNDCDGLVNEEDAKDAKTWYKDCDADGYASTKAGAVNACAKPAPVIGCTWTSSIPQVAEAKDWDCDDDSTAYSPKVTAYGFPPSGKTSYDRNCNGKKDPAPSLPAATGKVCSSAVVEDVNDGTASCTGSALNCILWKNAAGKYVNHPSPICPDSAAHALVITMIHLPDGSVLNRCGPVAMNKVIWPCR